VIVKIYRLRLGKTGEMPRSRMLRLESGGLPEQHRDRETERNTEDGFLIAAAAGKPSEHIDTSPVAISQFASCNVSKYHGRRH
jgi:hypothetical protein